MNKEELNKKLKAKCYCHNNHECHFCYIANYTGDLIEIMGERLIDKLLNENQTL